MGVKVREKDTGSGVWWIFVNHANKRRSKRIGDKKTAERLAKEARERLAKGDLGMLEEEPEPTPPALKFEEYADEWLKAVEPTLSHTTHDDYEGSVRLYLKPALGPKALAEIERGDVKALAIALRAKLKPKTVKKHIGTLSALFTDAIEDKKAEVNPTSNLRKFYRSADFSSRRKIDPLTREELGHLLTTAETHQEQKGDKLTFPFRRHRPFVLLLARTGLRLGEAIALQWGDVDFRGGFLNVQRSYVRGRVKAPKNGKSRRVDLSQQTRDMLTSLKRERFGEPAGNVVVLATAEARRAADADAAGWIFADPTGRRPLDGDNFRSRVFELLLTAAGLRHIRIHDLRHTYASLLIEARRELHYIQEQLGHHSPAFTLSVYGHLLPRDRRGEVDCLDDAPARTPDAPAEPKTAAA